MYVDRYPIVFYIAVSYDRPEFFVVTFLFPFTCQPTEPSSVECELVMKNFKAFYSSQPHDISILNSDS